MYNDILNATLRDKLIDGSFESVCAKLRIAAESLQCTVHLCVRDGIITGDNCLKDDGKNVYETEYNNQYYLSHDGLYMYAESTAIPYRKVVIVADTDNDEILERLYQ